MTHTLLWFGWHRWYNKRLLDLFALFLDGIFGHGCSRQEEEEEQAKKFKTKKKAFFYLNFKSFS